MRIYTNERHEIIGIYPNYIPESYSYEYDVVDTILDNKAFNVICGYKYEPQFVIEFNEDNTLKRDEHGNLVYKLDENGEKIKAGYALYAFIDSQVLARFQQEAEMREKEIGAVNKENAVLKAAAVFSAETFTDAQALKVKTLYPEWETFIGKSLEQGKRVLYENLLYKVRQAISVVLEDQYPSVNTAALYEEIVEDHAGTLDDPIPYNNNMELFEGKYYSQDGVVYKCTRGTGQAVYNSLKDLIGIYVELVS